MLFLPTYAPGPISQPSHLPTASKTYYVNLVKYIFQYPKHLHLMSMFANSYLTEGRGGQEDKKNLKRSYLVFK